ncbi:hypothetical protein ACLMJK_007325 [Lecanora helva]
MPKFLEAAKDRLLNTIMPSRRLQQHWTTHDANIALYECLSSRNPPVPNEIILQILDEPSRWLQARVITTPLELKDTPLRIGNNPGEQPILSIHGLSKLEATQVRCIAFSFSSRDQGWSHDIEHHRTFDGSWTWMEALLSRPSTAINTEPENNDQSRFESEQMQLDEAEEIVRCELQRNRHAGKQAEDYRHELGRDHVFVQHIQSGDSIVLLGRAMFPAWVNIVHEAKIEVFCMDDLTGRLNNTG